MTIDYSATEIHQAMRDLSKDALHFEIPQIGAGAKASTDWAISQITETTGEDNEKD
jgi:hypothetical protein